MRLCVLQLHVSVRLCWPKYISREHPPTPAPRPTLPIVRSRGPGVLHWSKHNTSVCAALTAAVFREGCDNEGGGRPEKQLLRIWEPGSLRGAFFFVVVVWWRDTCKGTVNVSVMRPRDGHGRKHSVIHQPAIRGIAPAQIVRHKDPAAPAARRTRMQHSSGSTPMKRRRRRRRKAPLCIPNPDKERFCLNRQHTLY